jgi:hypothetical protein
MTKAIDAKVGDKENCQLCSVEMTCGLTKGTPEHPAKQQWQVDGKAHYNFDFKTKTTTCNGVIIEDPKNVRREEVKNISLIPENTTTPYTPTIIASPEVLRQETSIEFQKVYNEFIPTAKEITNQLQSGLIEKTDNITIAQRVLREYITFYTKKYFR